MGDGVTGLHGQRVTQTVFTIDVDFVTTLHLLMEALTAVEMTLTHKIALTACAEVSVSLALVVIAYLNVGF